MVIGHRKKPEPKPKPKPEPTPPQPVNDSYFGDLTGTVRTVRANGSTAYGVPWSNITRYEPSWTKAARDSGKRYGLDPVALARIMAGMGIIESDGNQEVAGHVVVNDHDGSGIPSYGILQIKPQFWQHLLPDANVMEADGNIRLGTEIMASSWKELGSWQNALVMRYFPSDDPNGTSQNRYVKTLTSLVAEIQNNVTPPAPPTPPPTPPKTVDPIRVIVGGDYAPITYGFLDDVGLNYYSYVVGHGGTRSTQHGGVDVPIPDETPLYTPLDGVVDCVGWEGTPRWGEGCGYYEDTMGGGVGNITIYCEAAGLKFTLGHCSSATVRPGQRVTKGQMVGKSGGMNGYHVHVEVAILQNGSYWLVEPIAALRQAMGGEDVVVYAPRVPYDWEHDPNTFEVTVKQDGLPVLQRGQADSPPVGEPFVKNEVFYPIAIVPGNDGQPYWLGSASGRVPVKGTKVKGFTITVP